MRSSSLRRRIRSGEKLQAAMSPVHRDTVLEASVPQDNSAASRQILAWAWSQHRYRSELTMNAVVPNGAFAKPAIACEDARGPVAQHLPLIPDGEVKAELRRILASG